MFAARWRGLFASEDFYEAYGDHYEEDEEYECERQSDDDDFIGKWRIFT